MIIIILSIIIVLVIASSLYLGLPKLGKAPGGNRLEKIRQSPNFKDGKFQNISFTPSLSEGYSRSKVLYNFLIKRFPRTKPTQKIPAVKTDLKRISIDQNILVWFGHSSYYIQLNGKRFLIDPVFSGNASPIPNSNKSFKGTDIYVAADIPEIDFLLITHDHYDHLDYSTIKQLRPKIKQIVCGLGVGSHFEHWRFDTEKIIELDWNDCLKIADTISLYTAPTRHFSGRVFTRNNTLWLSFVLQTPDLKLYLCGDSGYDSHFAKIGEKFDGFDLAILDNGQYNPAWQAIHMLPEEGLKAAQDLKAKRVFPVHSSKFKLAYHAWDEPLKTITQLNERSTQLPLVTPKIGEVVNLNDASQAFTKWWEGLDGNN